MKQKGSILSKKLDQAVSRIRTKTRKGGKIAPARILIPVVIVCLIAYLVFSAWYGIRNPYTFVMTYTDTMADSVRADGWVVRNEQTVAGGNGVVQLQRHEGEKVGKGHNIATVYQNANYVERQEELDKVKHDLTSLQYATYEASPRGAALEEQMLSAMTDLRHGASSGNFTNLSDRTANYRKLVLRREYLISGQAVEEMTAAADQLEEQYDTLQSDQSGVSSILAEASGVFVSHLDGYETLLTPDQLDGLSPKDLANFSNLQPASSESDLGKLITSASWYYAAVMPSSCADHLSVGKSVEVKFDSLPTSVTMKVDSIGEVQEDQVVATLRTNDCSDLARTLRMESGSLIFESEEGIVVPREALRVDEDGAIGVYSVSGYKARFRPVEILAEDETNYLVRPDPVDETDKRILRTGDEVVLASTELTDGKVVR